MRTRIGAAVALAMMLLGCAKEKEKETEPVLPVKLAQLSVGSIEQVIEAEGVLRAFDQSSVMPKLASPVAKFHVNRGDAVSKGQLLATLESRDLAASVVDARGAFEQAAANYRNVSAATIPNAIAKAEADVQAAQQQLEAAKTLLESRTALFKEGALARRQVDEAAVAHAQAKAQYDTARKTLASLSNVSRHEDAKAAAAASESAKGRYDAARAQLAYAEVRSPIAGVVADRPLFAGEIAQPGTPLLTIVDISRVIARVNVPQTLVHRVKVGQPARVAANDGAVDAKGRVTMVSPAADPQSTTVEVWVEVPNPGLKMRPGSTVRVSIQAGVVAGALLSPVSALLPAEEGGAALYVVGSDLVAHAHKVKTGVRNGGKVQILDGAKAGDNVIEEGGLGVADGAKVKLEKEEKSEKAEKHE